MKLLFEKGASPRVVAANERADFMNILNRNEARYSVIAKREYTSLIKNFVYERNINELKTKPIEANYFKRKLLIDRSRFKRCCNNFVAGVFTSASLFFSAGSFSACANEAPTEEPKWGVFPLRDVSWCYKEEILHFSPKEFGLPFGNIYDTETGKLIAWHLYEYGYYTHIYSVKQISENQAELYISYNVTGFRLTKDYINNVEFYDDTTFVLEENALVGKILIEDKKVYHQEYIKGIFSEKKLMYDFSLELNDTIYINSGTNKKYHFFVSSIDSVLVLNEYRKRYNFTACGSPILQYKFSTVEGLGAVNIYFSFTLDYYNPLGPPEKELMSIHYKDKKIWSGNLSGGK